MTDETPANGTKEERAQAPSQDDSPSRNFLVVEQLQRMPSLFSRGLLYLLVVLLIAAVVYSVAARMDVIVSCRAVARPDAVVSADAGKGSAIPDARTRDMAAHTKRADILIVAAGFPNAVTADMVKDGAVVIDVGVNRVGEKPSKKTPGKMVAILKGDVDFDAVKEKASAITPVPGGVGPMTITMLMHNTLKSAKLSAGVT